MSDLETQDTTSMDDTIAEALADIQSRGVDIDNDTGAAIEADPEPVKSTRARDESGKFAKAEPIAEGDTEPLENDSAEPEKPPRKAPSSWKKEAQDAYAKLDPLAQDEIDRREADFHKGLESYKTKAQVADAFERAVTPYLQNIEAAGANPIQAVNYLLSVDHGLRHGTPEQKVGLIQEIMRNAGINADHLATVQPADPRLFALQRQNEELRNQFMQHQQLSEQQEAQALNSEIVRWAEGKEHFETVRDGMAALLQTGQAQTLDEAYEMALWAQPATRSSLIAKQQEAQRQDANRRALEAKKAGAVNIVRRGAPATSSAATGSMEDTLRAKAREMGILN